MIDSENSSDHGEEDPPPVYRLKQDQSKQVKETQSYNDFSKINLLKSDYSICNSKFYFMNPSEIVSEDFFYKLPEYNETEVRQNNQSIESNRPIDKLSSLLAEIENEEIILLGEVLFNRQKRSLISPEIYLTQAA